MTARLTLVSHHLCPYVQRAAISLAEKGVPFERIDVDLSNKPDWFQAISPLGRVPLLRVRHGSAQEAIFESAVILEFLEETEAHPLHPADPLARARHRAWIEFGSAILNAIGRFYSADDEATFFHESRGLSGMFSRLEAELAARRTLLDGRRRLRTGLPLFRHVRPHRRFRHPRRLAARPSLARSFKQAAIGQGGGRRRLSAAAACLPSGEEILPVRDHPEAGHCSSASPIRLNGSITVPATMAARNCGPGGIFASVAATRSRTKGNAAESDW